MNLLPLTSILLFCVILNYAIRKSNIRDRDDSLRSSGKNRHKTDTPEKKLSDIHFISFPENLLTEITTENSKIIDNLTTLRRLAKAQVINMGGMSNDEIRETYGDQNFEHLSMADQRYMNLCRVLQTLSEECFKSGLPDEAEKFLKFAIDTDTDFLPVWQTLGEYYLNTDRSDSLRDLRDKAFSLPDERFDKIRDLVDNLYNLCGIFE